MLFVILCIIFLQVFRFLLNQNFIKMSIIDGPNQVINAVVLVILIQNAKSF